MKPRVRVAEARESGTRAFGCDFMPSAWAYLLTLGNLLCVSAWWICSLSAQLHGVTGQGGEQGTRERFWGVGVVNGGGW